MKKNRQPLILALLVCAALGYGGYRARLDWLAVPLKERNEEIAKLEEGIEKGQAGCDRVRGARRAFAYLQRRSLPGDPAVARSLYRDWLFALTEHAGFTNRNVSGTEPYNTMGGCKGISFSVRGLGTQRQFTTFLFEFYSAGHLHQIRSLSITPLPRSDKLDLFFTIEALIMPMAGDEFYRGTQSRLAYGSLDEYQVIEDRNFFSAGAAASLIDPIDLTFLSAISYDASGRPEAWFTQLADDVVLKLRQGDSLEVGVFQGAVSRITESDVVLDSDGERWLLTIGENLAEASALPPGL